MKVITVVGARPQFIKLAPLSKKLSKMYQEIILHTGQHYNVNMSKQFFEELDLPEPDYNLGVGSSTHGKQTGEMLSMIEEIFFKECPTLVIVFGDTNSTLAGALASAKLQIPIIHVEAGLRSFNRKMPEEINRILTDHSSDFLFAPTQTALSNLEKEGLFEKSFLTGDIIVDSIEENIEKAENNSFILEKLSLNSKNFYLLTLHRPYNVDNPRTLGKILSSLSGSGKIIVFPIHPRTRKIIKKYNLRFGRNIKLIEPIGYLDMIYLEKNSCKIITDSGGVQKEAYLLRIPCVTVRPETEWVETIQAGWNILAYPDSPCFLENIESFLPNENQPKIFGDNVAQKMVDIISSILKMQQ